MVTKTDAIIEMELFIGGKQQDAADGKTFDVINPSNGRVAAKVAKASPEDTEKAILNARQTFDSGVWSRKSPKERADTLTRFAQLISQHSGELAHLESVSSGAIMRRAQNDPMKAVELIQQTVKKMLQFSYVEYLPNLVPYHNEIWREPIGVVSAITPWNYPMLLAMWKVVPALAMGNSIVVKPASSTPLSILKMAELAVEAGVPSGVFNVVCGAGPIIGEILATHPLVDKVAFTGSTEVGQRIMQMASSTVKRVTLELGGKSPAIVLPDADLDIAIPGILFGFCFHSGQICMSGTRVLVHDSIYDEVVERLAAAAANIKIGNAQSMATGMGPVISQNQLETILGYIELGIQEGARLVYGGKRVIVEGCEDGYYIQPTIFADATNEMSIAREEIFGPVVAIIRYSTIEEAVQIANDSIYGLAAGIWTSDVSKANQIARELQAGTVWINEWHLTRYDAPFGGYKQSGVGRELGDDVLYEYSETKHVHTTLELDLNQRPAYKLLF